MSLAHALGDPKFTTLNRIPTPALRCARLAPWCTMLVAALPASAQRDLATLRGGQEAGMGFALAAPGDIDGDGVPDLVVGAPFDDPMSQRGKVTLHSGATGSGSLLWRGTQGGAWAGWSVAAAGDVDGDGAGDVLVGIPGEYATGNVVLLSGATGAVLLDLAQLPTHNVWQGSGCLVAGAGDVDRDGAGDLLTQDAYRTRSSVWLLSGAQAIATPIPTPIAGFEIGSYHSAAGLGDVDGDGWPDFGAARANGTVTVMSGRLRQPMIQMNGDRLAAAGDVTGDGRADFLLTQRDPAFGTRVIVYAGPEGAAVHAFPAPHGSTAFGTALAGGEDLDDDGRPDFVIGDPSGPGPGHVWAFSGRTGNLLYALSGERRGDGFGAAVVMLGDVDGDGHADLAVGAPDAGANRQSRGDGYVRVVSGIPRLSYGDTEQLSIATGGCQKIRFRSTQPLAGDPYLVLGTTSGTGPGFSIGDLHIDLNPDGYTTALLGQNLPGEMFGGFTGWLSAQSTAEARLCIPAPVARLLAGQTLHHLFIVVRGFGIGAVGQPVPLRFVP